MISLTPELIEDEKLFFETVRAVLSDAIRKFIDEEDARQEQLILYGDPAAERPTGVIRA